MWVIFALLDPDPDSEYGSRSTDPIESGSATLVSCYPSDICILGTWYWTFFHFIGRNLGKNMIDFSLSLPKSNVLNE
jgi:hypothetical protein